MCCTGKRNKNAGVYQATNNPVVDPSTGVQLSSISYLLVDQEDKEESEDEDEDEDEDEEEDELNDDNDKEEEDEEQVEEEEEEDEDNHLDKVSKVSSPPHNY
jgi:hypothetical protein